MKKFIITEEEKKQIQSLYEQVKDNSISQLLTSKGFVYQKY